VKIALKSIDLTKLQTKISWLLFMALSVYGHKSTRDTVKNKSI